MKSKATSESTETVNMATAETPHMSVSGSHYPHLVLHLLLLTPILTSMLKISLKELNVSFLLTSSEKLFCMESRLPVNECRQRLLVAAGGCTELSLAAPRL